MEKNLTSGSVLKSILYFSLPYLLSYFLQTLYGMADLFIIGQFEGVASTTAVSIGSQVMHMITVMIVGLAMGTTVTIGRAVGAGNRSHAAKLIGNTVTLFLTGSVVLAAVLVGFVDPIIRLVSVPEEAVAGAKAYLIICFIGIPCITAYNILASIFRGLGDSKSPMYFIAIACVSNIALDYLFMGALHLGPAGAALGTTLSQLVSVVVSLLVIRKRHSIRVTGTDLKPKKDVLGELLGIGVPVMLQDGFIQVSFMIITIIANHRGLTDAAAVGIVEKIISFLFLVPSSMLSTVSALGAQNIGAGKHDRADAILRYAIGIGVAFGTVMAVLISSLRRRWCGLSPRMKPWCWRVHPTSGVTSLTVCLRASSSVSAVISALTASRGCPFCTTACPSFWCACRGHIWRPGSSRRRCCPWVWRRRAARCFPVWCVSLPIAGSSGS